MGCLGEIDYIPYLNQIWTTSDIEKIILLEYSFRGLQSEWIEQTVNWVARKWNKGVFVLAQNMLAAEDFDVGESIETFKETANASSKSESESKARSKSSNTPNEYILGDGNTGLNMLQDQGGTNNTTGAGNSARDYEKHVVGNTFQTWLEVSKNNRNIIYDFVHSFEDCFEQTVVVTDWNARSWL